MSQKFQEYHLHYLVKECQQLPYEYQELKQRLLKALDTGEVEKYFKSFQAPSSRSEALFIPCALCLAPTSNEANSKCARCHESSEILQRLLSGFSKIWSTTQEGGKLLDCLSNLASFHDRRNIYCPDCRGLIWSPVPHTVHHFPDCSAHESRKT